MKLSRPVVFCALLGLTAAGFAAARLPLIVRMGKQPDGSFLVSSGQRVEPGAIAFDYRPIDLALHPSGQFVAVLNQREVFLANHDGILPDSRVALASGAGYRGAQWSRDGARLWVSVEDGYVQEIKRSEDNHLTLSARIRVKPEGADGNPRPGGMALTRDGRRLYVATADRNAVAEIDTDDGLFAREFPVQNIPFAVRLSDDEKTLLVSNWGGRKPDKDDEPAESGGTPIVVDARGAPASGTLSFIDRATGNTTHLPVGLHPTDILVKGSTAYVANAASENISVVDVSKQAVARTLPLKWGKQNLFGSMPCALALSPDGSTLYIANGGDNAVCEMDARTGSIRGYRPAGYYPLALALAPNASFAYVLNTKGNGSVRNILRGKPGSPHDFQGTVSIVDLRADLKRATEQVVADNGWNRPQADLHPKMAVYNGAIKHVLYIIKENLTYDQVLGDLQDTNGAPLGNGDPHLAVAGKVMPNHHALARQFTLCDNGYVSGTNSADGHAWSTQSVANDYMEHFYTGYRTYPDDGDCAMSISEAGTLWDAAAKKDLSIRVYGEFCDDRLATFNPPPKDWMDVWKDRFNRPHKIKIRVGTRVAGLKKYIHPEVVYWPLLQSDQTRADLFIEEYNKFSRADVVPQLMVLSLPCDHTEGLDPHYPKPKCMIADNDLALGRVVEAISHSPQWKDTCIFVIEDDGQSGPDHIDGHRVPFYALSPYTRRKFVDSTMYTTCSMLHSIELMLGFDSMTKFDALSPPLTACFAETPDLTPYNAVPATIALDEMNPPLSALQGRERYWAQQSARLDWSGMDRPNLATLRQVLWHSLHGANTPYPQ